MNTITVRTSPVRHAAVFSFNQAIWTLWLFINVISLNAQTPIIQPKPEFKAQQDYKTGTFTIRILHVDGQVECGASASKATKTGCVPVGPVLAVTSSDKRITGAIVEVFYQTRVAGVNSTGPLLLHRELICPILIHDYAGNACNQDLDIPVAAIKMIRIRGSAEVETAEIGKP